MRKRKKKEKDVQKLVSVFPERRLDSKNNPWGSRKQCFTPKNLSFLKNLQNGGGNAHEQEKEKKLKACFKKEGGIEDSCLNT